MSIPPETRYARNGATHLACQVLGSGRGHPPDLLVVGAPAAVTVSISVPVDTLQPTVTIPCNGDTIAVTGGLHVLMSYTINGNHVSGKEQFQPQGVSGTDLTTGAEYQGTGGVTRDDFSGSFINGQYQETFVDNFRFPGQGSAVNYLMHENAHVTINANGTVTANFDKLSISCG